MCTYACRTSPSSSTMAPDNTVPLVISKLILYLPGVDSFWVRLTYMALLPAE